MKVIITPEEESILHGVEIDESRGYEIRRTADKSLVETCKTYAEAWKRKKKTQYIQYYAKETDRGKC